MYRNPFYRCACGKMHVSAHTGLGSVCTCGLNLYKVMTGTHAGAVRKGKRHDNV